MKIYFARDCENTTAEDYEPETCQVCGRAGFLSEAKYEDDWVNCSDRKIITCPECDGEGEL